MPKLTTQALGKMPIPPPKRRALFAILLGLTLGLVAAETAVRLAKDPFGAALEGTREKLPRWSHLLQRGLLQYESDSELHYSLAPGFDFEYESIRYRTNSLGMRGPEVALRKPEGTRRILMLGDSYAYGLGAPEDGTLQAHLAAALNAAPSAQPTEVLNLGVPAYHTGQELAWLERTGFALEPDLVILVYFANDATEPAYHYNPRLRIIGTDETEIPYAWKEPLSRSAIYALLARSSAKTYANSGAMSAGTGQTWPLVEERLTKFVRACEAREVPLVIVNLPSVQLAAITADKLEYGPHLQDAARVAALLRALKVPGIELAPLLQELAQSHALDALLVDPTPGANYDDHFTSEGNRHLASFMAAALDGLL